MWLFTRYGFYSVVCARGDGGKSSMLDADTFMFRARSRKHLETLRGLFNELADAKIGESKGTDYAFRMIVPKELAVSIIAALADDIDYGNFKNEAHRCADHEYANMLHGIWSKHYGYQREVTGRAGIYDRTRSYFDDHDDAPLYVSDVINPDDYDLISVDDDGEVVDVDDELRHAATDTYADTRAVDKPKTVKRKVPDIGKARPKHEPEREKVLAIRDVDRDEVLALMFYPARYASHEAAYEAAIARNACARRENVEFVMMEVQDTEGIYCPRLA